MEYISIEEAVYQVLSKSLTSQEALARVQDEDVEYFEKALKSTKEKLEKSISPAIKAELIKFDSNGQWQMKNTVHVSAHPVTSPGAVKEPKDQRPDPRTGVNIDKTDGMSGTMPDGGSTPASVE